MKKEKTEEQLQRERDKYKRYRDRHREKVAAANKAYKASHREKINTIMVNYRSRLDPEIKSQRYRERQALVSSTMTDTYIKKLICSDGGVKKFDQIPMWMVELKRDVLILKRLLKKLAEEEKG